ncbi:MAG TPA: hypothetical protein VK846_19735 [Candidatus Limnocylindria bacterium]|nr:hypothetical protein [Candidatus Limnocylindria bacterium]
MNDTKEVLHPDREIKLRAGPVKVRELSWHEQREFTGRLCEQINSVLTSASNVATGNSLTVETLLSAVKESSELSEWLVCKCSGLSADEVGKLSLSEFFAILDIALDLNFSVYMSGAKKAFGRIGNLVGKNAAGLTAPTVLGQQ